MAGFFAFKATAGLAGKPADVAIYFKAPGSLEVGALAQCIEVSVQSAMYPDVILVVCPQNEMPRLLGAFRGSVLLQARERLGGRVKLLVGSFDKEGVFCNFEDIVGDGVGIGDILREKSDELIAAGLSALFSCPHLIFRAPPGFEFVKPSGERSTFFIRTEDALSDSEHVYFLAFCLLKGIAERHRAGGGTIEIIFVDSMAMYGVGHCLAELYRDLYESELPRVESFHSHAGLSSVSVPLPGTSYCIISASASLRLQSLWISAVGCSINDVKTVVSVHGVTGSPPPLYCLSRNALGLNADDQLVKKKALRIVGERFLPEEVPPKRVLIGRIHGRPMTDDVQNALISPRVVASYVQCEESNKVRPIYVDGGRLIEVDEFRLFLTKVVLQRVPASVKLIIHQSDKDSMRLSVKLQSEIESRYGRKVPVVSAIEIGGDGGAIPNDEAIVIVASVVGRSTGLLSISRDLRDVHVGARLYLIGACVVESDKTYRTLESNLVASAVDQAIDLESFAVLRVGNGVSEKVGMEIHALSRISEEYMPPQIGLRLAALNGHDVAWDKLPFLPQDEACVCHASIRKDFQFWMKGYLPSVHCTPLVFATMSCVLQAAREYTKSDDHRLASDAFQQVLIDPRNFARFNDGVVQAAILRASNPHELDYTCSLDASFEMKQILQKVFASRDKPQGEMSLEFALALAVGWLRLASVHSDELKEQLGRTLSAEAPRDRMIGALLGISNFGQYVQDVGI